MKNFFFSIGIISFLAFGVFQLALGFLGIEYHFGTLWASIAVAVAIGLRFTIYGCGFWRN